MKKLFDSFINFIGIVSLLVGCYVVYSSMWIAHTASPEYLHKHHFVNYLHSLNIIETLLWIVATPAVSVFVGCSLIGIICYIFFDAMLKGIMNDFHKIFEEK